MSANLSTLQSRDPPAKRGETCPIPVYLYESLASRDERTTTGGGRRERQKAATDSRAESSAAEGRVPSPTGHIPRCLSFLPACLEDNIPLNGVRGDGGREEWMGRGVHGPRYKGTLEGWRAR